MLINYCNKKDASTMLFTNKALKKLIFPLIIEQVLAITVGMADVMMVSNVGEAAISGVSLVDMINYLIISIFAALATGGAVVTSQFIGAKEPAKAQSSAKQLVIIAITISLLITLISVIFRDSILRALFGDIEPAVMSNASLYFLISAFSFPFLALYNSCAALYRAMGNSSLPMRVSILMNIINVAGNAILIFGFHRGVEGVAIPSLVSRVVAALIIFILIRNKSNEIYVRGALKPNFKMIAKILNIAIPSGLENGIFQFGRIIVVSIIAGFGTTQIAANAVANSVDSMGCIAGQAMNLAIITVIGRCVGANDDKQIRYYTKKLITITYIITAVINSIILLCLPFILNIFKLSADTRALAFTLIMIHNGFAMLLWPLSFTLPNALRACNDVRFAMIISIFSMFSFRIALSYYIGRNLGYGAIGVWIAMVVDWIFRVICFSWRFVKGKYRKYI